MGEEQEPAASRAEATGPRQGKNFYARIGWISHELRQRAREGNEEALSALERRQTARTQRRDAWRELVAAREAVHMLREELRSRARANVDAGQFAMEQSFAYSQQLRQELQLAEAHLSDAISRHDRILRDLRALPKDIASDIQSRESSPDPTAYAGRHRDPASERNTG